jgi:hypothetical protein
MILLYLAAPEKNITQNKKAASPKDAARCPGFFHFIMESPSPRNILEADRDGRPTKESLVGRASVPAIPRSSDFFWFPSSAWEPEEKDSNQ